VLATALARDVALLKALAAGDGEVDVLVWIRGTNDCDPRFLDVLISAMREAGEQWLDLEVERIDAGIPVAERALSLRGLAASRLLHVEHGMHLFLQGDQILPISVTVQRVPRGTARAAHDTLRAGRAQWVAALQRGQSSFFEAPHPIPDVIRIYAAERVLDLRSGIVVEGILDGAALRELMLGGLT
jgi:hypothetical protein